MHVNPSPNELRTAQAFSTTTQPAYPLSLGSQNDQQRLALTVGSDVPPSQLPRATPDLKAIKALVRSSQDISANLGGSDIQVADAVIGIVPLGIDDAMPQFVDLGSGNLATLLDRTVDVGPDDQIVILASTTGHGVDIYSTGTTNATGNLSGADPTSILEDLSDTALRGSLFDASGQPIAAAVNLYQMTANGPVPIGQAGGVPASAATATTLTASNPSPRVGQPLTFTATVTPTASGGPSPTGTIQFEVNGSAVGTAVDLVNGAATSGSITLTAGSHTINALYSGDATYAGATGMLTLSAAAPTPTVALSTGNSTPIAGQALAVMVLVTPPAPGGAPPTGTVQFEVDGSAVGAAAVTLGERRGDQYRHHAHGRIAHDHRGLLGRRHLCGRPRVAHRDGRSSHGGGERDGEQRLHIAGQALTFTATVTPSVSGAPTPTGTVQFEVDGSDLGTSVALVNGAATSGSVTLTAGSHTVTAVYSGDATYAGGPGTLPLTAIAPGAFAVGSLDPTFGSGGVAPIGNRGQATEAVALDDEGRIVTVGQTALGNFILSRYTADGQPDLSFGDLGVSPYQPSGDGFGIAFEPDGKIIVMTGGGTLVRFYSNGALDTTFGTNGVVQPPSFTVNGNADSFDGRRCNGSRAWPDGRVLYAGLIYHSIVGGNFSGDPVPDGYALVMYLPDGQLDTSFNGSGTLVVSSQSGIVQALAVTNNEILVMTSSGNDPDDIAVTAYHFDGTLVSGFGADGVLTPTLVDARGSFDHPTMAIQPDGKILLGYVSTPQSLLSGTEILFRYNADGTPDTTFGTGGTVSVPPVIDSTSGATSLAVEPDGKILVSIPDTDTPETQRRRQRRHELRHRRNGHDLIARLPGRQLRPGRRRALRPDCGRHGKSIRRMSWSASSAIPSSPSGMRRASRPAPARPPRCTTSRRPPARPRSRSLEGAT